LLNFNCAGWKQSGRYPLPVIQSAGNDLECARVSPGLSAELIDRAIVHYRNAARAIAAIAHDRTT